MVRSEARCGSPGHARTWLLAAAALGAALVGLAPASAARTARLESRWRADDAPAYASHGGEVPLDDGRVSVAAMNDRSTLYLTLTTRDRGLYFLMYRSGLTVWLDPKGGRRKWLGIRYPLGVDEGGPASEASGRTDAAPARARVVEILEHGASDPKRFVAEEIPGFDVGLSEDDGTFVYSLKIPLGAGDDRPVSAGAGAGGRIGVGWVTASAKPGEPGPGARHGGLGGRGRGGFGGGGRGGFGGGGPWGGEGRGGTEGGSREGGEHGDEGTSERPKPAAPLKVWAEVQLAVPTAAEAR